MEHISSLLLVTIFIVALLLVLFAIFKPRTIYEGVLIVILVLILIFYYARELEALILIDLLGFGNEVTIGNFEGENSQDLPFVISRALDTYHKFILDQLPEFNGISVFGNIWFNITINRIYVTTIYPIVILGSGIIIRLVINRFILNKNLRRVGREYWLFITTFATLATVFSNITNWTFLGTVLVILFLVLVLAAGLIRVVADIGGGLRNTFEITVRLGRVLLMYLALIAARVTRILRRLVAFARKLYGYIIRPFTWLYNTIKNLLEQAEQHARALLKNEQLDEDILDGMQSAEPQIGGASSASDTHVPLETQSIPVATEEVFDLDEEWENQQEDQAHRGQQ